ncbi:MAG: hypothetical protein ACOZNI_06250 [Myxococcota bacterium]
MKLSTFLLLVAAVAGAGWCWLFGPFYWDHFKMSDVVGTTALTWAAYNEERARAEFKHQLKQRGIPDYLTIEACAFHEGAGGLKVVDCRWYVDVVIPFTDSARRLNFQVLKTATPDGRLTD